MERQRSFSFKPTRFLVFSFTIYSSFIFLTFFTIWIIKATPLVRQPTHLQFNRSYPNLGPRPITVLTLTGFSRNFTKADLKNPFLIAQDLSRPRNSSGFGGISLIEGIQKKSEAVEDGGFKGDAFRGNFTEMQENVHKASPEKIKVSISGSKEEKKTRAGSLEKIEASTGDRTEEKKKIIATSSEKIEVLFSKKIEQRKVKDCDLTKGSWVFDESYPLYTKNSCPFIDEGFDCDSNGRLDKNYMKWRWQPNDCDIPRFNATKMLELIKGKRLVFVGDSINRNQWESMLCMLMGAIRDPKRVYETHGRKITKEKGNYSFKFMDYQCTVEYYVSHFLVHESKARIGQKRKPTLRIDAIDHGSSRWRGADILIFNTAHWWSHYKTKVGVNYYQEGNQIHPQLNVSMAFRKALTTWASWVDKRINPRKTQIFFRSSAPSHFRGGQWNSGGHCMEASHPLNKSFSSGYPEKNIITDEVIKQMKTRVTFLNITSLSEYRIDGHPSIFGRKSDKRQLSNNIQDCSHWCLPGVPDSWNELLYFNLLNRRE